MNKEFPEQESGPEKDLQNFREEVAALKRAEEGTGIAHLTEIDPGQLGPEDMEIYKKLVAKNLTVDELNYYKSGLKESGNASQKYFAGYVSNKLMVQMGTELMDGNG